jgi:ketopantoate reductase
MRGSLNTCSINIYYIYIYVFSNIGNKSCLICFLMPQTVVDEFLAVAHACNISLGFDNGRADALAFIHSVATNTSTNTSSMLADVLNGRETEIEAITGSVVRRARRHGVAVPAHEHLLVLVRALRRHHPGERDAQG